VEIARAFELGKPVGELVLVAWDNIG